MLTDSRSPCSKSLHHLSSASNSSVSKQPESLTPGNLLEKYRFNSNKTKRRDKTVRVTHDVRQVPPLDTPVAGVQSAQQLRWTKQPVSSISLVDATRFRIPPEKRANHKAARRHFYSTAAGTRSDKTEQFVHKKCVQNKTIKACSS